MDIIKQLNMLIVIYAVLFVSQTVHSSPTDCFIQSVTISGFINRENVSLSSDDEIKLQLCNNIGKALKNTLMLGKYMNCEVQHIVSRHIPNRGTVKMEFIQFGTGNRGSANLKPKLVNVLNTTTHTKHAHFLVNNNTKIVIEKKDLCDTVVNEVQIRMKRHFMNGTKNNSSYETVYLDGDVSLGSYALYKEAALQDHTSSRFQTVQRDICLDISNMIRVNQHLKSRFMNCSVMRFYGNSLRVKYALIFSKTSRNDTVQETLIKHLHHLDHTTTKYNLENSITVSGCSQQMNSGGFARLLLVTILSSVLWRIH